jgi:hypothetical protein
MSDLLRDARDLRTKLYRLETLLLIEKARRPRAWFEGKVPRDPDRPAAIRRLSRTGLIEPAVPPAHFRLTPAGRDLLKDVRAKVGSGQALDWTRADEIDFSRL